MLKYVLHKRCLKLTEQSWRSVNDPETDTCEHSESNEISGTVKEWIKVTGLGAQTPDQPHRDFSAASCQVLGVL